MVAKERKKLINHCVLAEPDPHAPDVQRKMVKKARRLAKREFDPTITTRPALVGLRRLGIRALTIVMGTTVKTGPDGRRGPVSWMPDRTINGHGLIIGSSGVGKTHRLRLIAEKLARDYKARVIIVDVHGDISVPGEDRVEFTESSKYGLNPLKINPDRHSGGVRRRIRGFLSMLNRTSMKLGVRQEAALTRLLEDLYSRNGFDAGDWRTWDPLTNPNVKGRSAHHGVCPNISDLKKFTAFKLKQLKTGAGGEAFRSFNDLAKAIKALNNRELKSHGSEDEDIDPALDKLRMKAKETYCAAMDAMKSGDELNDLIRYSNIEVLNTVLDRIDHLDKAGIFKDHPPPLNPRSAIHVYDVHSIGRDEQKMFLEILLEELWLEAKSSGQTSRPETFIIIDEASIFVSDDPDHILNILIREARKFGLGILFASQSISHFSEDVLANVGLKLILGVDQMFVSQMARMLRVDPKLIDAIRPRTSALVQCKVVGDQRNDFTEIYLTS